MNIASIDPSKCTAVIKELNKGYTNLHKIANRLTELPFCPLYNNPDPSFQNLSTADILRKSISHLPVDKQLKFLECCYTVEKARKISSSFLLQKGDNYDLFTSLLTAKITPFANCGELCFLTIEKLYKKYALILMSLTSQTDLSENEDTHGIVIAISPGNEISTRRIMDDINQRVLLRNANQYAKWNDEPIQLNS